LLVVPGNQTVVKLSPVNTEWFFAVSGNTPSGSTGLTQNVPCKYQYNASLEKRPQLKDSPDITEHSILVQWMWNPSTCGEARVIYYVLIYKEIATGSVHSLSYVV
jgi:hypothetical protein